MCIILPVVATRLLYMGSARWLSAPPRCHNEQLAGTCCERRSVSKSSARVAIFEVDTRCLGW